MNATESLPAVLIPGLICTPRLYSDQLPALWSFGPVTVADHRRGDSIEAIARRILADAPPRFALAGLSMGGYIALAIVRLAPERVARLALLDTGARADTPEQTQRRNAQIAMAQNGELAAINEMLWPLLVHKKRQNDTALRQVVTDMALASGVDAFVSQQRAIMGGRIRGPGLPRSPVRRLSSSATATSSRRPRSRRRWLASSRKAALSSLPTPAISRRWSSRRP